MSDVYQPKARIQKGARIQDLEDYRRLYRESLDDPERFWDQQASRLDWFRPYDRVHSGDMNGAHFSWFEGGKLNVSYNCLDRHLEERGDRTAIIWAKDDPGDYEFISYRMLHRDVCRMANLLIQQGVRKGDRVCIYMPMMPRTAVAMLACSRIGAIHSVVFAGFSAESLRGRIVDADCRMVITADEGLRGGKRIPLKKIVDDACDGTNVDRVLVARRTGGDVPMCEGRDLWLDDELRKQRGYAPAAALDAEDPLFILYTSGSTGRPKGVLHTSGGYLLYASMTQEYVFDCRSDDVYCCAADVGWITGHSYVVYGPLANGATTVMFESVPTYPDPGRYWQVVQDLEISIFYTAPTALRAIAKAGDSWVSKFDRSSLRVLGSVGEPINPEIWQWYHDVVGDKRCAVVDTWWQTETGGIMITPLPGATPCKPGSATLPFFGVEPALVDEEGREIDADGREVTGRLVLKRGWPGQARTLYGDHERFHQTYFSTFPGLYFTGDGCRRDADGYYWITGRVDDVLNVSGHRLGTAEVESALVAHDAVAEAAVVGCPHDVKGQGIYAYVHLAAGRGDGEELIDALRQQVREVIGPIATPDHIQVVPGLPKTRSGKIMRRILRKVAEHEYGQLGDVSTLADPSVVEAIVEGHKERFGS